MNDKILMSKSQEAEMTNGERKFPRVRSLAICSSRFFSHSNFVIRRLLLAGILLLAFTIGLRSQETEHLYLSGHGKDDAVPWKFYCTSGANSGFWTNLPVPSQWDMHGFGTLSYHKDLTNAWEERGLYEHEFVVPEKWLGKRIFLVFGGVMTDTDAKLNGQSVGPIHEGGFYRFKYEVTPLVRFGETNKLEVTVSRHSANASVNRAERLADYWVFAGIYRPVYLEAVPQSFIERVAIDARADGGFSAQVFLNPPSTGDTVEAQIQTLDGKPIGDPFNAGILVGGERPDMAKLKTKVSDPKLWSAETPNLYKVLFRLEQNGKVIHEVSQRFGFRTFEVRDGDGLYLNGRRIILKGCDRHSFWPDSGRCLSEQVQELDVATLKDMNMNAVRMSHYPPDAQFLDLCDEQGLYVLDELAGWHHYYDNTVGPKLVREMVERDVNHPCILFWDNGNEGGFNTNLDKVFGEYDPQQRRVLHPWAPFNGLNTAHYLPWDFAQLACQGIPVSFHKDHYEADTNSGQKLIYMPTEFMHGLYDGGAGAGLADTWGLMERSPYLGGGFIWAFLDEGVRRPDTGEIDVAGNQAPDGIVGPYRQREASFYTIKQIWSPLVIEQTNLPTDFGGMLTLKNHYSFINARQCHFNWQLRSFAGAITGRPPAVIAEGKAEPPYVPPGGKGELSLPLPSNWRQLVKDAGQCALSLRMTDPEGFGLWTYEWPLPAVADLPVMPVGMRKADTAELSAATKPEILKSHSATEVVVGDMVVRFDAITGYLAGVKCGGRSFSLANGPRPALGEAKLIQFTTTVSNNEAVVTAIYSGSLKRVIWHISSSHCLECEYTCIAEGTNAYSGVVFDYPENRVKSKRWLGNGPYRVWKNRLAGVTFGLWDDEYNNTVTGWRDWAYPEFKGCFADVRWMQLSTTEGGITVVPRHVPYMQVLTPDFPPVRLSGYTIPSLPECGLGFLNSIPPIGSKFQPAAKVSPSGEFDVGTGEHDGLVRFCFGDFHDEYLK